MDKSWDSMIVITPLCFFIVTLTFVDSAQMSQQSSFNLCPEGVAIVNCSHLGIVFADTNFADNFTCTVCCETDMCCQLLTNITLRLDQGKTNRSKTVTVANFDINETVQESINVSASEDLMNSNLSISDDLILFKGFNGSDNYLKDMPYFDGWVSLKWLDLSNNLISFLTNPLCFENLSELSTLSLRNNMLSVIFPTMFSHLHSLQYLYLNDNPTITDWSFLNNLEHLDVVDIRVSCNKNVSAASVLSIPCVNNVSLIHDNSTCVQESVDTNGTCSMLLTWPNIPYVLSPIIPCKDTPMRPPYYTSTMGMPWMNSEKGSTTENQKWETCMSFTNSTFDFLSSGKTCVWFPMLVIAGTVCIIAIVVMLVKWRVRVKRDGRYSKWLSVYSPNPSGNEPKIDIIHEDSEHKEKFCQLSTQIEENANNLL